MAAAVCGCSVVRDRDGSWIVADVALECPFGHAVGMRGTVEGEPSRVTGVGECVTLVFERASRTAMLATPSDLSPCPDGHEPRISHERAASTKIG